MVGVSKAEAGYLLQGPYPAGRGVRASPKTASQAGFKLRETPIKPSPEILLNKGKKFPPSDMHKSWSDFLYFDNELEK